MALKDSIVVITNQNPKKNRNFGTGFVIHTEEDHDFLMTCRHVVSEVAASKHQPICINYHQYSVLDIFQSPSEDPVDMAILKIKGPLGMTPLPLSAPKSTGTQIRVFGYYLFDKSIDLEKPDDHRILPVDGELGEQGFSNLKSRKGQVSTWNLNIKGGSNLKRGYSGSPVIDLESGSIIGFVSHSFGQAGDHGIAVSIETFFQEWPDIAPSRMIQALPGAIRQNDEPSISNDRPRETEPRKSEPGMNLKDQSPQIFISYARGEDEEIARRLYQDLEKAGMKPWMDKLDLLGGELWKPAIQKAIEESTYFIATLSKHSVSKTGFVQKELKIAFEVFETIPPGQIYIVPVRLDDSTPLHDKLKELNWIDLFPSYEDGLDKILRACRHSHNITENPEPDPPPSDDKDGTDTEPIKGGSFFRTAWTFWWVFCLLIFIGFPAWWEIYKIDLGRLYVNTTPPNSNVEFLDSDFRFSNGMRIEAGKYLLRISKDGFVEARKPVEVIDGKDTRVDIELLKSPHKNSIGMTFTYIPAGEFQMGSPPDEPGRDSDESPQHPVTIEQGVYMQTTEVTQGQWKAVMGENPSYFKNCGENCPVESVSWEDAKKFIRILNEKEGRDIYRLPTEAEWEYAARAGSRTAFANGEIQELECGLDPNLDEIGWYCGNSKNQPHEVAQKIPNEWRLFDMHGNVWEWCSDWYGEYPSGSVTDPSGPNSGETRVLRGGSWSFSAGGCRSAGRYGYWPDDRYDFIGFRLTRSYP